MRKKELKAREKTLNLRMINPKLRLIMRIIGGIYKGQPLKAPKGDATRPTSSQLREAVFNICQTHIEGADFLDLFCGSGAIGIEALSRGAKSVTFVDKNPLAISALKENLEKLKDKTDFSCLRLDVMTALKKLNKDSCLFDIIYVDPPYEASPRKSAPKGSYASQIVTFISEHKILKPGGFLFIEEGGEFERTSATLQELNARTFGKSKLFLFTSQ